MSLVCPGGTVRLTQAGHRWECQCGAFGDGYKTWDDVLEVLRDHLLVSYPMAATYQNDSVLPKRTLKKLTQP